MTDKTLTMTDRLFVALARHIDRRVLAWTPSQPLLRVFFSLSVRMSSRLPKGTDLHRAPDGTLTLTPPGVSNEAPLLLYIHGGGFTIGSPDTHAPLAARLAQAAGMRAMLPPYPLAPEHPYPAAQGALFALYRNLVESGTAPAALCGDSAGGCLALQVACHARNEGLALPKVLGLIGPAADFSDDVAERFSRPHDEVLIPPQWAERIDAAYLPQQDKHDPAISPLLGDLSGLPPTFIQVAEGEILAQDAHRLARALDDCALDLWPGLQHVWHIHAGRAPAADRALDVMGAALAVHVRASDPR